MRTVDIELVFEDGSSPVTKTPTAQVVRVNRNEDTTIRMSCFNEDGSVRDITSHVFTLGLTSDAAGQLGVLSRLGSIDGDPTLGIAVAVINDDDTSTLVARTYYLSVAVDDGEDWQPIPQSPLVLLPVSARIPAPITPVGPEMALLGVPEIEPGDVGKFLKAADDDPRTLEWATVDTGSALPDQTGNAGKFLSTDGASASWETVDALPDQTGNSGKVLTTDGATASWQPFLSARNLLTYGAVGDGVADDGPALQAAFDDTPSGGSHLFIPEGTYRIATPVAIGFEAGTYLHVFGVGGGSRFVPDLEIYEDAITVNNTLGASRVGFESLAFTTPIIGTQPADPQCYRALVIGGTHAAGHYIRDVIFAGLYVQGAVAYLGNGATNLLVDNCDWIGCQAAGDTGVDPQSLLEFNIIFGATVRNCRFLGTGYFAGAEILYGSSRQCIRFRHFDVPDGLINASKIRIDRCTFQTAGNACVSSLEPDGNPNGPTSPIMLQSVIYGGKIPTGKGVWTKPAYTTVPSGGFTTPYVIEIRIDTDGVAGVATWSTRYENAGFGGGFTGWTSQGAAASASVNSITLAMGAGTFASGDIYQLYVTGQARFDQVEIRNCEMIGVGGTTKQGCLLTQCDNVIIEQLQFDAGSQSHAIELYDCDVVKIVQPSIASHKIFVNPAGFGFGANEYVYVEDPNDDAVLTLNDATAWKTSTKGVETTGP